MKHIPILLILLVLTSCIASSPAAPETTQPNAQITLPVGLSFPPISTASGLAFTIQQMDALDMTLVRIGSNWANREPEQGNYHWEPLDKRINALHENGASILFTIPASGPDWTCGEITKNKTCVFENEDAFRTYVTALIQRYAGKIDKIQFGNEWDNLNWYPGTAEEFVNTANIVYEVVQEVAPETTVVLGGLTAAYSYYDIVCKQEKNLSFTALNLKNGKDPLEKIKRGICNRNDLVQRVNYVLKNAYYDMVDLHLYDSSEHWPQLVAVVKELSNKPLIISEFGGPSADFERYSQAYHAHRLEQYLLTLEYLTIEEAYYFNLVDNPTTYHSRSGLFTIIRQKKKAFYVMQRMIGAGK